MGNIRLPNDFASKESLQQNHVLVGADAPIDGDPIKITANKLLFQIDEFIARVLIGFPKGYIRPVNVSDKESCFFWMTGDIGPGSGNWVYNFKRNESFTGFPLPIGTKVLNLETDSILPNLQENKIYTLQANGQVTLDESGGGGSVSLSQLAAFMSQKIIGVPKGDIYLTQQVHYTGQEYVTIEFTSNGWKLLFSDNTAGVTCAIPLEDGTKVLNTRGSQTDNLTPNRYYILGSTNGTPVVTLEKDGVSDALIHNILTNHVGVLSAIGIYDINTPVPNPVDYPLVGFDPLKGWYYEYENSEGEISFILSNNTLVKTVQSGNTRYYKLNNGGTITQVNF